MEKAKDPKGVEKNWSFFLLGVHVSHKKKKQLYFPLNPGWILIMVYGF